MRRKNNLLSLAIGAVIGTTFAIYASGQQTIQAEAYRYEKPAARVWQVELPEAKVVDVKAEPIEAAPEEIKYFDVPLSEELQDHIFAECKKHNIAPAIIVSMIAQESSFDASVIGDDGESTGLLQIQSKWHEERMERLGVTDLLDPFQNVTVAVDYLAELKDVNSDLYWVLMAYNGGFRYANRNMKAGTYSAYAVEITERAAELEKAVE